MDKFGVPKKINRHILRALYGHKCADIYEICDLVDMSMRNNVPVRDLTGTIRQSLQNMVQLGVIGKKGSKFFPLTPKRATRRRYSSDASFLRRRRNAFRQKPRQPPRNFIMENFYNSVNDDLGSQHSVHATVKNESSPHMSHFKSEELYENKSTSTETQTANNEQNAEEKQSGNNSEDRILTPNLPSAKVSESKI